MDLFYFMFKCLIVLLRDVWVWKPSGEAFIGPLIWPVHAGCWGYKTKFLRTQLSRNSCFNVENSLDIISHYKMRLVSSETHETEENKTQGEEAGVGMGEEARGVFLEEVKAELALCMQGKGQWIET